VSYPPREQFIIAALKQWRRSREGADDALTASLGARKNGSIVFTWAA
jgi:hypothetical protein